MDKPTESQPLDDLFRRKLNQASVQPSSDAWNQLQRRIAGQHNVVQDKPTRRIGAVWYWSASAAAACLLLTLLWSQMGNEPDVSKQEGVAINQPVLSQNGLKTQKESDRSEKDHSVQVGQQSMAQQTQVADNGKLPNQSVGSPTRVASLTRAVKQERPVLTNRQAAEPKTAIQSQGVEAPLVVKAAERPANKPVDEAFLQKEPVVAATVPPKAATPKEERTLVVQVAEPKSEMTLVANQPDTDESETEASSGKVTKLGRVFQQIKRIKDGGLMAKADVSPDEADDESGFVNRLIRSGRGKDNHLNKQQK